MRTVLLIPFYNESPRLPDLLARLPGKAERAILVDDGSADGSGDLLERWARPDDRVVRLPRNGGKSRALAEGLRVVAGWLREGALAAADVVVLMDGDGQHPPEAVPGLAAALVARDLDMLVACRDFSLYPAFKVLGNRVLTWQACLFTGVAWRDTQCGMRALRAGRCAEVAEILQAGRYACEQEMCVALPLRGWRVANDHPVVPGHFRSNSTMRDALQIFGAGLLAWQRHRRPRRAEEPAPSLP